MIERTVFHHKYDNSVEGGVGWRRKRVARLRIEAFTRRWRRLRRIAQTHHCRAACHRENAAAGNFPCHSLIPTSVAWHGRRPAKVSPVFSWWLYERGRVEER